MKQSAYGKSLTLSILSLSLLTVMAGAAVAPALGVIRAHFSGSNQLFVHQCTGTVYCHYKLYFPEIMQSIWRKDTGHDRITALHCGRMRRRIF